MSCFPREVCAEIKEASAPFGYIMEKLWLPCDLHSWNLPCSVPCAAIGPQE